MKMKETEMLRKKIVKSDEIKLKSALNEIENVYQSQAITPIYIYIYIFSRSFPVLIYIYEN